MSEARWSRQRVVVVWLHDTTHRKLSRGGWCNLYAGGLQNTYGEYAVWLTNLWSKGSRRWWRRNAFAHKTWGKCGGVKAFTMKHHMSLQATSSLQAQSRHLRVYVQIELSERGKSWALPIRSVAVETYKSLNPWWKWCHSTYETGITSRGGMGTSREGIWKSKDEFTMDSSKTKKSHPYKGSDVHWLPRTQHWKTITFAMLNITTSPLHLMICMPKAKTTRYSPTWCP